MWCRPSVATSRARRSQRPPSGLLAFSLSNPDGTIARHNIERWRNTGSLDVAYLQTLSADAAPAIAKLPPGLRDVVLVPLADRLATGDGWGSLNLSRHRAREILAAPDTSAGDRIHPVIRASDEPLSSKA